MVDVLCYLTLTFCDWVTPHAVLRCSSSWVTLACLPILWRCPTITRILGVVTARSLTIRSALSTLTLHGWAAPFIHRLQWCIIASLACMRKRRLLGRKFYISHVIYLRPLTWLTSCTSHAVPDYRTEGYKGALSAHDSCASSAGKAKPDTQPPYN